MSQIPPASIGTFTSETESTNTYDPTTNKYHIKNQRQQQNPSAIRRVARRACLSCREKKIKCDGEPISTITIADGTSKVMPEKTRICSNCAFLDIECIFVQSNRGGRRKKRTPTNDENSDSPDISKRNRIDIENDNNSSLASSTERLSSYILGTTNPNRLPSPVQSQISTPFEKIASNKRASISDTASSIPNNYNFPRAPPPPPSSATFDTMSQQHQDYFHHTHLPPLHHHHQQQPSFQSNNFYSLPPPPPASNSESGFGSRTIPALPIPPIPPPSHHFGPPQHFHFHGPPPHHFHGPPPHRRRGGPHGFGFGPPPHHRHGPHGPHFYGEPPLHRHGEHHHRHRPPPPPHFCDSYYGEDESSHSRSNSRSSSPELTDMSKTNSSSMSDKMKKPFEDKQKPSPIVKSTNIEIDQDAPFADFELSRYELPKWSTLNKILNYYYIYNQPSHQFFPFKSILLQNLSLNIDASIIHAIIATVILIIKRKEPNLKVEFDEIYWINKMYKYWENLNDLGILACYKLISKCTSIRFNTKRINKINIKIWEIISENNYIEIFNQKKFEFNNQDNNKLIPYVPNFGTKRQIYEREVILNLIWTFYINHIIILRFNQGRPYYKLSTILDGFKFDYERDHYSNNILLPLDSLNFNHLKVDNRASWSQLHEKDYVPSDSASLIISSKIFENLMTKLSNSNLNVENQIYKDEYNVHFKEKISNLYYNIIESKNLIVINNTYWFANLILTIVEIIQYDSFINKVMIFKTSRFEFKRNEEVENGEEIDEVEAKENERQEIVGSFMKLISDEFLPETNLTEKLKHFDLNQWKSLIELTKSLKNYIKLIELIPNLDYSNYSIVIGPTILEEINDKNSINGIIQKDWFDNPQLRSNVKQSWNKLPMYTLSLSTANLSIFSSVAVLTKYLKFYKNESNNKLIVEFVQDSTRKDLDIVVEDDEFINNFNQKLILNQISTLCEFIKFKLYYSNEEVMMNTIQAMNKVNEHLDSILSS
ncbi:unnamed protein product [Candida verbasci]|uniref:Zn(2)-C6 fungal-type domain-containing protein n=1 Tax=Candida verbasci TaxID=1227364 RepID=A0A9W4TUL0_9ASCO|nr:unnamed protein product [Candida verbasci]